MPIFQPTQPRLNPRSLYKKFKFIVELGDIVGAGVQQCGKLFAEVVNVQYFEGGL